ncbi:MAG: ABC transporter permease [Sphingobacteriales bacterium]|nr:ABC transporter permease [Sphingobacteriales bacterium]MBI3718511.1 ABC transporter permease [Sphingobacteriales bacterium]
MRRSLEIIATSFRLMWEELRNNKLRTFLSLLGIIIGIFCIVGVLATVRSMQSSANESLSSLGSNTVYVQKWEWGGGSDYPWWKFWQRPQPKIEEMEFMKKKIQSAEYVAYAFPSQQTVEYENNALDNVQINGITAEFNEINTFNIAQGRYLTQSEFDAGTANCVIGNTIAENLFTRPENAIGKEIRVKGMKMTVVGVIAKQGKGFLGSGWNFDESVLVPYLQTARLIDPKNIFQDKIIIVKGKEGIQVEDLKIEMKGLMRAARRLGPKDDDTFALNDISSSSQFINNISNGLSNGGIAITVLSFVVGIFGVANIMFVTVKERTSMIGLKKAIGAKRRTILLEILLESAFLCIVGGLIGLVLVFLLTLLLSGALGFKVFISIPLFLFAIGLCIFFGILAGIIPAINASRLDPVVAIRSK